MQKGHREDVCLTSPESIRILEKSRKKNGRSNGVRIQSGFLRQGWLDGVEGCVQGMVLFTHESLKLLGCFNDFLIATQISLIKNNPICISQVPTMCLAEADCVHDRTQVIRQGSDAPGLSVSLEGIYFNRILKK
jgi:hypothetical protein